ncbi:MAG: ferric iron uptake transcriptional regulator [Lautropia sp.]|nr:ferric iron uptake transcriptional regulator [Lautropia sp.]
MNTQDQELRSVGLKATLPRIKVLEIIRGSDERHLSAEDVFRRLLEQGHDVGLATVYRVLSQLEGAGLLSRNVFDGGKAVFEINEGDEHDHLICVSCGRVDEFTNPVIEKVQYEVADEHGYELAERRLALYGICPACRKGGGRGRS